MEEQLLTAYLCFWLAVLGAVLGSFLDCAASRWAAGDPHPFRLLIFRRAFSYQHPAA